MLSQQQQHYYHQQQMQKLEEFGRTTSNNESNSIINSVSPGNTHLNSSIQPQSIPHMPMLASSISRDVTNKSPPPERHQSQVIYRNLFHIMTCKVKPNLS